MEETDFHHAPRWCANDTITFLLVSRGWRYAPARQRLPAYAFLYAWNEYLYALLLLTGEKHIPLPVAMWNFLTTDNAPWNLAHGRVDRVLRSRPWSSTTVSKHYRISGLVSGAVSGS
jgi:multiple sugar transport system permease protein